MKLKKRMIFDYKRFAEIMAIYLIIILVTTGDSLLSTGTLGILAYFLTGAAIFLCIMFACTNILYEKEGEDEPTSAS